MSSIKKHIKNAKNKGLSNTDIYRMLQASKKTIDQARDEATEEAFLFMLAFPLNVLVNDYWSKSAKKRAPKFIEEVISLYHSVQEGVVTKEQLADLLYDLAGVKIEADWLKGGSDGTETT